jgi:hypothetical protein
MKSTLIQTWNDLIGRPSGPFGLRFIIQPAVVLVLAIRAGLADAKTNKPAYLWAILLSPGHRKEMLRDGWKDVAKVFVLASVLDVIYQLTVFQWIYPLQTLLIAVGLAIIPYILVRGPVSRVFRHRLHQPQAPRKIDKNDSSHAA